MKKLPSLLMAAGAAAVFALGRHVKNRIADGASTYGFSCVHMDHDEGGGVTMVHVRRQGEGTAVAKVHCREGNRDGSVSVSLVGKNGAERLLGHFVTYEPQHFAFARKGEPVAELAWDRTGDLVGVLLKHADKALSTAK
jgi:hypothetical protein